MALSPTDICNLALLRLGQKPITQIAESPQCAAFYPLVRDVALSWSKWTFAMVRHRLARLEEMPASDFRYYYALPTQPFCLRVVDMGMHQSQSHANTIAAGFRPFRSDIPYQREVFVLPQAPEVQRSVIATNADAVILRYIARTNESVWMPLFDEVVMLWLAKSIGQSITGRAALVQGLQQELLLTVDRAITVDGHQDTPDELVWDTLYLDVRQAYYATGWPHVDPNL